MNASLSTAELSRMTATELRRSVIVARNEYAAMRMAIEMQTEKNHARFKAKRREIARMSTVLTAMEKSPKKVAPEKKKSDQKGEESALRGAKKPVKASGSAKAKKSSVSSI